MVLQGYVTILLLLQVNKYPKPLYQTGYDSRLMNRVYTGVCMSLYKSPTYTYMQYFNRWETHPEVIVEKNFLVEYENNHRNISINWRY